MIGIVEMFAELDGRDRLQRALEEWGAWRAARDAERDRVPGNRARRLARQARYREKNRAAAVERTRRWRMNNPDRARAYRRTAEKRRRERAKVDPTFGAKYRAIRNASQQRARERERRAA